MPPFADLVCLSHLRWNFVYQRPNHLMSRAARSRRVYFVEEPVLRGTTPHIEAVANDGLMIVRPVLPEGTDVDAATPLLREELDRFLASEGVREPWLWYYTPMALRWSAHLNASAIVFDCMDELTGFKSAPPMLRELEQQLLARADVVFAGGRSLYEAKRGRHRNLFLFPSSVDAAHFRRARDPQPDPADQASIPHPRVGYYGVIDERIDLGLLAAVAEAHPDWQLVMVGPLAKIEEADLPRRDNIHWLGGKDYEDLPRYLSGWDVAMMPFALNESTRFISPTKTPEYLSGGRPVVSTPITDVVHPYGDEELVHIAAGPEQFASAIERALAADRDDVIRRADRFLATQSWDATWAGMEQLVHDLRPTQPLVQLPPRVVPPSPAWSPAVSDRTDLGGGVSMAVAPRARPR